MNNQTNKTFKTDDKLFKQIEKKTTDFYRFKNEKSTYGFFYIFCLTKLLMINFNDISTIFYMTDVTIECAYIILHYITLYDKALYFRSVTSVISL